MRSYLLFLVLVASVFSAEAQTAVGPEAGLVISNLSVDYPGVDYKNRDRVGFRAGIGITTGIERAFSIHTGAFYHTKGSNVFFSYNKGYYASHFVIQAFQVPVYFNLQGKPGPFGRLIAGAGLFVDYHFSGKEYVARTVTESKIGSTSMDDIEELDYGFGLQAGYRINNGILLKLQYQHGIPDFSPSPMQKMRSRNFAITIAYIALQSGKKAKKED